MGNTYRRYAFISYNHKDEKWAKWLQRKLESYKLPNKIQNEFKSSRYLRPIFRDKTDLNTGVLANELRVELEQSKFLIVICSPNSAKSNWVSEEVKFFIDNGRIDNIIPFIVDGTPHNYQDSNPDEAKEDECFPSYLRSFTKEHPELELLGININEVSKEQAFIRVVSRMLAVSFDVLWERNRRQTRNSGVIKAAISILFMLIIGYVWHINQPFNLSLSVTDQPKYCNLSYIDGEVVIYLENDTLSSSITKLNTPIRFNNIPSKYRNERVRIIYNGFGFNELDTLLALTTDVDLVIYRNPKTYGFINGYTKDYNDKPIAGVIIYIGDYTTITDDNGYFELNIALEDQLPSNSGYEAVVIHEGQESTAILYPICDNNINNTIYIQ